MRSLLSITGVLLALLAAGCGGDDDPDRAAPPELTQETTAAAPATDGGPQPVGELSDSGPSDDQRAYDDAASEHTIAAYREYVREHPDGIHADGARDAIRALRADRREAVRRARAARPRNIVTLIERGSIVARATGVSIQTVSLTLRNRRKTDVTVSIAPGTFFAAGNASVQNMVATEGLEVTVEAESSEEVDVDAACANRTREIPDETDRFTILRGPPDPVLRRVARLLRNQDMEVRQAAVWIVTDNATFADLQVLQTAPGVTVIQRKHARRAMKLLLRAGVDITQKAIWQDRDAVYWKG